MFRFIIALYLIVYSLSGYSNNPLPPSKSFIISFFKPTDAAVLNEVSQFRFAEFVALNIDKTIFKASYSTSLLNEEEALHLIYRLPDINIVQEDGPVYLRSTIPNDSLISRQPYLSRIDAYRAWDLTRGGINRRGDTIVVAVVDDGLHINHQDFKGNIWINYADIENNGLDDDNNGFIDDHYGWNFMGRNNDISDSTNYAAGHGSRVAGVIGARGNDITGICGIMWNVKMMFSNLADSSSTAGSNFPFQSDVIRAYDYVLQQRKLYNSSNGKKGAFVVAINSSWGVDRKFANQAPIWCAMYDSLGKYGILTAGGTTNSSSDVEDSGDLPSLCTSNHLIVVSTVNNNDDYASRGFGTTSVDISAPGESIYTTYAFTKLNKKSGLYGSVFSGTSAATPMVTAAIGLINTYACEKLMDVIKSDPEAANLLIRRFILEGVDILPTLVGKNVTTGRLNIFKALKIMDQYCYGDLSLHNNGVLQKLVIFPNPGNGILTIESFSEIINVECYDPTGKLLLYTIEGNKLDLSGAENGVYFIRVLTSEGLQVLPYVKND